MKRIVSQVVMRSNGMRAAMSHTGTAVMKSQMRRTLGIGIGIGIGMTGVGATAASALCSNDDVHFDESDEEVFHLLSSLRDFAPKVDCYALLKLFLQKLQTETEKGQVVDVEFVKELFHQVGVDDPVVAESIFAVMDWNRSGTLEPPEISATFTLFQMGSDVDRYRFLFRCLDLDRSGKIDKDEFRFFLTALLEARYNISGLEDPKDPPEWYANINKSEYHAIAKLKANMLVRTIFNFADTNRDGELNMKEFLHWCKRGGHEVAILNDLLSHCTSDLPIPQHGTTRKTGTRVGVVSHK